MIYVTFNFEAGLVLCSSTKQMGLPMHDLSALQKAVIEGEVRAAVAAAHVALEAGVQPVDLISQGIGPAMAEVGKLFEEGEYFVPELLMAARATKEIFVILRPLLAQTGAKPMAQVLLGTVQGDLHDIGKNLVAAMLEGGGFEVTDLGVDVPPEKFIEAVKRKPVQIVGLSALLTTTMPAMKNTIEAFRTAGIRDQVKIMVGGAPVTREWAEQIGADGTSEDAISAVTLAKKLVGA